MIAMKRRHQTGSKKGNPAYRTPAVFRYLSHMKTQKAQAHRTKNSGKKSAKNLTDSFRYDILDTSVH